METASTSSSKWRKLYACAAWLLFGVLLGLLKLLYSFLPLFNLLDVIVFGFIGSFIGRRYESGSYLRLALAVLPPLIVTGWAVSNLSLAEVMHGIGTGWVVSVLLIPASAVVGERLGARMAAA